MTEQHRQALLASIALEYVRGKLRSTNHSRTVRSDHQRQSVDSPTAPPGSGGEYPPGEAAMPTRDGTEAHTNALLGDLEDLSEALMEMVSAGVTRKQERAARDLLEALQRATQHAKQLAKPEVQGHGRLHLVDD